MKTMTMKIKNITVVREKTRTDNIVFTLDGLTQFPKLGYDPIVKCECARGHAETWLKSMGLEPDNLIEV